MNAKTRTLKARPSDPIVNHLVDTDESEEYLKGRMDVMMDRGRFDMTSLQYLKYKLGAQTYCEDLSNRNWVWEREFYRVYCSRSGFVVELIVDEDNLQKPLQTPLNAWSAFLTELFG